MPHRRSDGCDADKRAALPSTLRLLALLVLNVGHDRISSRVVHQSRGCSQVMPEARPDERCIFGSDQLTPVETLPDMSGSGVSTAIKVA